MAPKDIAVQFKIEGEPVGIYPTKIGLIHQTYRVETTSRQYLLQGMNQFVFKRPEWIMHNIEQVARHLEKKNYPRKILRAIATADEQHLFFDPNGQCWRLFPYFDGSYTVNEVSEELQAYDAAYAFGEYARYLVDLDIGQLHTTLADFHHTPQRFRQFEQAIKAALPEKKKRAQNEILRLRDYRDLLKHYDQFSGELRVVHYDTKINNILFDQDTQKPLAVIDLDTLMPGLLPYDYGDMVRTYTPPVDENESDIEKVMVRPDILQAINTGYLEGLKESITPVEKANLTHGASLIIYEQAMRFLTDYLLGNPYYQVSYEEQNLARANNQLSLLHSYLELCTL